MLWKVFLKSDERSKHSHYPSDDKQPKVCNGAKMGLLSSALTYESRRHTNVHGMF